MMEHRFHKRNVLDWIAYSIFALSLALLASIIYFIVNIRVLDNWTLTVAQKEVHVGETLAVKSVYTKLRDVSGTAKRYIECKGAQGVYIAYPVNEAVADRPAGKTGTGVLLTVPTTILDAPTTCRVRISLSYPVLPFRTVNEANSSNEFRLLPETEDERATRLRESGSAAEPQSTGVQDQASVPMASSPQNTPNARTSQPDMSQQSASQLSKPDSTPEQPGLIQRTIDAVSTLVDNVF